MKSVSYLFFISIMQFTFVNGQSIALNNKNLQEVKTEYGLLKVQLNQVVFILSRAYLSQLRP